MPSSSASRVRETRVRGEPVVRRILDATLGELARIGYAALRVEDVAVHAEVNKTTIYRRWPTKAELVRAALVFAVGRRTTPPDTGSLRGDLLTIGRHMVAYSSTPRGRSLALLSISEEPGSELLAIGQSLRKQFEFVPRLVMQRAVARGELAAEADGLFVLMLLRAALFHRAFVERLPVDERFVEHVVDVALEGTPARRASPRRGRR